MTLDKNKLYSPTSVYMPLAGSKGYFADDIRGLKKAIQDRELDELVSVVSDVNLVSDFPFDGKNQTTRKRFFYIEEEPNSEPGLKGSMFRLERGTEAFFIALDGFIKEAIEGDLLEYDDAEIRKLFFEKITAPIKELRIEVQRADLSLKRLTGSLSL